MLFGAEVGDTVTFVAQVLGLGLRVAASLVVSKKVTYTPGAAKAVILPGVTHEKR